MVPFRPYFRKRAPWNHYSTFPPVLHVILAPPLIGCCERGRLSKQGDLVSSAAFFTTAGREGDLFSEFLVHWQVALLTKSPHLAAAYKCIGQYFKDGSHWPMVHSRDGRRTESRPSPAENCVSPAQPSGSAQPPGLGWAGF